MIANETTTDPLGDPRLLRLQSLIATLPGALVALSGGVDSTLMAAVAQRALGDRALAVTAVSPSLAPAEQAEARELAQRLGIAHREIETREIERAGYVENSPERCFHCKDELYSVLAALSIEESNGIEESNRVEEPNRAAGLEAAPPSEAGPVGPAPWTVLDGTNADDVGDHRPGRRAAALHGVRSPLMEAGLTKADVRELARLLDLPNWDKPAMACLASRVPYGTSVTVDRLRQVATAEAAVRALGFPELRVRHHGDVARIEVPVAAFERLLDPSTREAVLAAVSEAGFTYVALDLAGLRSGSMNDVLALQPVARD